ncbi:MAG: hypothetical protein LBS49_00530 [Candidatus Accumulibacter sp.]|jgi:hypothetical protein|nr:hypothetical protein [Accumulibacter sp.]
MAFVNERLSESTSNWAQYGMPEIKKSIVVTRYASPGTVTVDHERNIYLICVAEQTEDHRPTGLSGWVFSWHGHLLWVEQEALSHWGDRNGPGGGIKRITRLGSMDEMFVYFNRPRQLPDELKNRRDEILKDLYDALLAYKGSGIFSTYTTYELTLDVAEGV